MDWLTEESFESACPFWKVGWFGNILGDDAFIEGDAEREDAADILAWDKGMVFVNLLISSFKVFWFVW